jgi:hypothetical protein
MIRRHLNDTADWREFVRILAGASSRFVKLLQFDLQQIRER